MNNTKSRLVSKPKEQHNHGTVVYKRQSFEKKLIVGACMLSMYGGIAYAQNANYTNSFSAAAATVPSNGVTLSSTLSTLLNNQFIVNTANVSNNPLASASIIGGASVSITNVAGVSSVTNNSNSSLAIAQTATNKGDLNLLVSGNSLGIASSQNALNSLTSNKTAGITSSLASATVSISQDTALVGSSNATVSGNVLSAIGQVNQVTNSLSGTLSGGPYTNSAVSIASSVKANSTTATL
ncbi:MAG: hypothetical protein QM520_07135, partial [Gammaproteobacteria bacterium]|nr:hypothetical protein [Gammaproteobacteria bacterium]